MSHPKMTRFAISQERVGVNVEISNLNSQISNRSRRGFPSAMALLFALFAFVSSVAAQSSDPAADLGTARRVFVPAEELDVVIERDHKGVLLKEAKFQELITLARANAAKGDSPKLPIVMTGCDYEGRLAGDQLLIIVTAEITQFQGDWQSIAFPLQRLAIEKALMDGEAAMLGRAADGSVSVLSDKVGKHVLKLELSTELTTQGSDQIAGFSLMRAPSGNLSISLPAGKRLLIGALQLERPAPLDQPAEYKVAVGGVAAIQLRITDRAAENSADALTMATTGYGLHVAPGEVTWHALTTLHIFGKPIDRLTFSIPNTLEIADIEATGLEAWTLADDPNDKQRTAITVTFGQAFDGLRKISFKGVMSVEAGKPWTVPPLTIDKVSSHIGQVLVQHAAGVRLRIEESQGVRRATHSQKPTTDMPDDMTKMNATEFLRFDVWQPDFILRLTTQPKQREVQTAIAAVLDVNATGLDLQAMITVQTQFAPLFEVDVRLASDWTVISAQRDNQPLRWQVLNQQPGENQLRVLLAQPLAADTSGTVRLTLRRDVEGWPVETTPIAVALPELFLPQSSLSEMAFVVRGDDDLDLSATDLTGLDTVPLKADFERLRFQSQDTRYGGKLKISRKPSRIAVQTVTFGRLDPQTRHVFIQALVEVSGGGIRTLKVALPESTGTTLQFQSPTRPIVEQKPAAVQNGERIWTLQFDQRVRGVVPLFVDLDLPRGEAKEFVVPQARFVDAERQNGFLAAEAGGEQRLMIEAKAADGTALAESDPLDLPAVNYTPKERVVAVYRAVSTGTILNLSEERFDKLPVPTAVCPMLDVTSVLGRTGELQHRATFSLTAVGVQGLRVILPEATTLWATMVDGQPVEVRRHGAIYLIPLVVRPGLSSHKLELFYQSKMDSLTQFGTLEQPPPELSVQVGQGTSQPVEVLDQRWRLHYPASTLLVGSSGPLEPEQKLDETSLLARIGTGVRIPTLSDLGWQAFAVVVTMGVIALIVLAYRKGVRIELASMIATIIVVGLLFALLMPAVQQARNASKHSAIAPQGAPPVLMAPADGPAVSNGSMLGRKNRLAGRMFNAAEFSDSNSNDMSDMTFGAQTDRFSGSLGEKSEEKPQHEEFWKHEMPAKAAEAAKYGQDGIGVNMADAAPKPAEPKPAAQAQFAKPNDPNGALGVNMPPSPKEKLALLSLSIDLNPPEGSLQKTFRYAGADTARHGIALNLNYVDEHSGNVLRVFLVALLALASWFLPRTNCLTKATLAILGLTLPPALLPLVPQSLQVILDGLFFGVVAACVLWTIAGIIKAMEKCCVHCCDGPKPSSANTTALSWFMVFVVLAGSSASAQTNGAPAASPAPYSGSSIIVPFDAAKDPVTSDKILLPFDKFTELFHQAFPDKRPVGQAPLAGGIVEALYSARIVPDEKTIEDSTVEVRARFAIRSYVDGQFLVELPVGAVATRDAKLDGKNAPLIVNGACTKVAISNPGLHVVDFVFSLPARLSGSTGTFTIPLTPVPSGKLALALPTKDLSVRINGSSTTFRRVIKDDTQSIELPIDKGGNLVFAWQPELAKGAAAAVIHVDSVQAITLMDAGTRVSTGFMYRIRQGSVADVTFSLPASYRLQAVNGSDVGGWELQGEGDTRKLRVLFRRNVSDTTQLTVETYLDAKVGTESSVIEIPQLAPMEVTNEIGQVAVFAGEQFSLRAETVESLTQVDANKFSPGAAISRPNVAPQLAYRFSKRPFALSLRATRQASQANVAAQQAVFVTRHKQQLTTRLIYNLTGSPRSSFNIAMPAGYVLLDVKATGLHDWSVGTINGKSALTIDLKAPRLGIAEVILTGAVSRESDTAASVEFPLPLDATKLNSTAAVWLDGGFTANVDSFEGWRSVNVAQVGAELQSVRANQPVQFAFQSQALSPTQISMTLRQATPKISANGLTMVTITDVSVVHTLALQWKIDAASTDSLTFTTPAQLAGRLEFTGTGIRETTYVPAGDGRTRWTIWFRTPVSGKYFAAAVATLPPATTEVVAPAIVFEKTTFGANNVIQQSSPVEGQRQYVLLINSSECQLTSATPELTESVQREDVPVVVDQSLVDQATELVRVKQLLTSPRWTIQKFAQTPGAPASVNVADLTTVVNRDGTYRGQANYVIKNRSRQFLALKLPANTEVSSVFVANEPSRAVTATRNNQTVQLIALPKTSAASLSFPVRVVWRGRLPEQLPRTARFVRQSLDLPAPIVIGQNDAAFGADFGIPVARTRWSVWLPDDLDVQPLKDSIRNNLTLLESDQNDLLYEKAAVQELSELLFFCEQTVNSGSNRTQTANSLKQLGLALDNAKQLERAVQQSQGTNDGEFLRQKNQAVQRLSQLEKNLQAEQAQSKLPVPQQSPIATGTLFTLHGTSVDNNSATLLNSNAFGIQLPVDNLSSFGFELQNKDMAEQKEAAASKGESNAKAASQQTRQLLQNGNGTNIDVLNDSISQNKSSVQLEKQLQQNMTRGRAIQANPPASGQKPGMGGELSGWMADGISPTQGGVFIGGFTNPTGAGGQFGGSGIIGGPGQTMAVGGGDVSSNSADARIFGFRGRIDASGANDRGAYLSDEPVFTLNGNGGMGVVSSAPSNTPSVPLNSDMNRPQDTTFDVAAQNQISVFMTQIGRPQRRIKGIADDQIGGEVRSSAWTQLGGLSLPFEIPATGKKLVFSKTGGDPKLALAVRPLESIRRGLNLLWSLVWLAIGLGGVAAIRSKSINEALARHIPLAVAALSLFGFVLLPPPFHYGAFATFVVMSLIIAWINRRDPQAAH